MVVLLVLVAAFWMAAKYAYKPLDKAGDCDTIKQRIQEFLATRGSSRDPSDIATLNTLYAEQKRNCGP